MDLKSGKTVELRELSFKERPKVLMVGIPQDASWQDPEYYDYMIEKFYTATELAVTKIDGQPVTEALLNTLTYGDVLEIGNQVIADTQLSGKKK
jgi:hypothetical protein